MDINKFMDLFGIGEDKQENLDEAMDRQILPDTRRGKPSEARFSTKDDEARGRDGEPESPGVTLPDHVQLIKVGRCPSCGDQIIEKAELPCAWCNTPCRHDRDGFHLVHVALGVFQERHVFCSDECFEAFRRMYPARVHRNCYERSCDGCEFCMKRFVDESDDFPCQDLKSGAEGSVTPEKD